MGLIEREIEALHVRATPVPGHEEMARWHLMARVSSLPDLPTHPNVREATEKILRKPIYREVLSTLESDEDFGLLNRGIRVNAHLVEHDKEASVVRIWFDADEERMHGVFDGGRTYAVIKKAQEERRDIVHQWVDLYVYENAPPDLIQRMVETHNTAVQVQALSLADHRHEFQRIREALYQAGRLDEYVAWHEGDEGEVDAREVVALLIAVDSKRYPPRRLGGEHPIFTYSQKARALKEYQQHRHHYERLAPIAPDVLRLRDHIQDTAPRYWPRGNFGSLKFVETRRCMLPFVGVTETKSRSLLTKGALVPIISAFRHALEISERGVRWLAEPEEVWAATAADLLEVTRADFEDDTVGRNPNQLGKSRMHWRAVAEVVGDYLANVHERETDEAAS
jgi:hypothetical protein